MRPWGGRPSGEFDRLISGLQGRRGEICELILARLARRFPDREAQSAFTATQVTDFLQDSVHCQLRAFALGALPAGAPRVDTDAARAVVRSGELSTLLNAYRAAQAVLWEIWFGLVEDSDLADEDRRRLLSRGSEFFFAYADLVSDHVAGVYQSELKRSAQSGEQRRLQAVRAILEGRPSDSTTGLDFDLDRHHLALIAWGPEPLAAARALAEELRRPLLALCPPDLGTTCWAWLSGTRPLEPTEERRLQDFRPTSARIAVGLEGFGEHGFRAGHRQAAGVRRCAAADGPALVRYQDAAIEALTLESEEDARAFVERELRGLDDDSETSCRLRETLQAYFDAEYNAACAAATLGVHQQTVANRLRAAEDRLGHRSIGARHLELQLALRLRPRLVPDDADRESSQRAFAGLSNSRI